MACEGIGPRGQKETPAPICPERQRKGFRGARWDHDAYGDRLQPENQSGTAAENAKNAQNGESAEHGAIYLMQNCTGSTSLSLRSLWPINSAFRGQVMIEAANNATWMKNALTGALPTPFVATPSDVVFVAPAEAISAQAVQKSVCVMGRPARIPSQSVGELAPITEFAPPARERAASILQQPVGQGRSPILQQPVAELGDSLNLPARRTAAALSILAQPMRVVASLPARLQGQLPPVAELRSETHGDRS